jgi:RNA polymerase I-specific transcription initiation factor RRN3
MYRVHMALKYLLRLIPSASGTLSPILSAKFPDSEETKKIHMSYIDGLLRIIEYAPELKSEMFALITQKLVKIDVQMQVDLDDMEDEVAAAIVQQISLQPSRIAEADEEDDDDSDVDSVTSDDSVVDEAARIKLVQDNVEKMDAILDILFSVYTPYFSDPNSLVAQSMFDTLLSHFRNIILPTYRSRHTQFLLFHFAQTSEHLVDTFAGECVDLAFKSGRPAVLKQSAAAYLASFVSRGAHVLPHVVRDVFDYIGTCLDTIRDENEQTCRGPDLQRYGTFYATTQALLYIFCFRWRDLVVSSEDDDAFDEDDPEALFGQDLVWRPGVKELLWRTINSKLNPLKICAPPIVEEFAKIAHRLEFMHVYPRLEANKRVRLSQFALGAGGSGGMLREAAFRSGKMGEGEEESWHQLDAYFPFDPYQLPVSKRWIEGDYVEWKGIPGESNGEDGDDSTDDAEDGGVELDDDDVDTATDEDEDD